MLAPLLLVVAVLVRVTTPGSAFHHGDRIGRAGRPFRIHKFRTMTAGAAGPPIACAGDPRVTALGRILRATRIDELPQLWNVLAGEMSLVGPRPEAPPLVDVREPAWRRVLAVRPGITGPSQLAFAGRELDLVDPQDPERSYRERVLPEKLRIDAEYAETRSLRGDVALLARTVGAALRMWR